MNRTRLASIDPRQLCQIEIQVSDLDRAEAFYAQAFGWPRVPADLYEYRVLQVPADCPFGISLVPGKTEAGPPGSLLLYFAVDDPVSLLLKIEAHGGKKSSGPTAVAGYGFVYLCEDPDGTRFGLYSKTAAAPS